MRNIMFLISALVLTAILLVVLTAKYFDPYKIPEAANPAARFGQTLSVGHLTLGYPKDLGLAFGANEAFSDWPVPPCNLGFEYCLYYRDKANGAGAGGLRINLRPNLKNEDECLNTSPLGYEGEKARTLERSEYATSMWLALEPVSASATSTAQVYRIFTGGSCYELERRLSGKGDPKAALNVFNDVIDNIVLTASGLHIVFPY